MKALLLNGGPHEKGCVHTALTEIANVLREEGVATQIYWLGHKPISGCLGCFVCQTKGQCVIDDKVNEFLAIAKESDAFVFGAPVHYASACGTITSFLDRVFFASQSFKGGHVFELKPGAAIVTARRAGTTAALDRLNKYFTILQMPIVSSRYWNMVHGHTPEEAKQDEEGLWTMRVLGRNMAYFLKCLEAGRKAGIAPPKEEEPKITNFIR
ncbi:MAG: flavodoxin family protein [Deltaproteobacteria bacterium]|jgi:multimeric flavodoxin WrbA|nr:flavodoxin family protein [Deltaproteobacteria bacterium]